MKTIKAMILAGIRWTLRVVGLVLLFLAFRYVLGNAPKVVSEIYGRFGQSRGEAPSTGLDIATPDSPDAIDSLVGLEYTDANLDFGALDEAQVIDSINQLKARAAVQSQKDLRKDFPKNNILDVLRDIARDMPSPAERVSGKRRGSGAPISKWITLKVKGEEKELSGSLVSMLLEDPIKIAVLNPETGVRATREIPLSAIDEDYLYYVDTDAWKKRAEKLLMRRVDNAATQRREFRRLKAFNETRILEENGFGWSPKRQCWAPLKKKK